MRQHTGHPEVLSAGTLIGDKVRNNKGETLGKLEEIMIDLDEGRVAYAVLSFGGFLGVGDKLFAIPWEALVVDTQNEEIVFDVQKKYWSRLPVLIRTTGPRQRIATG